MSDFTLDLDGLCDRCSQCGARARYGQRHGVWYADCDECPEGIQPRPSRSKAICEWNRRQRECRLPTEGAAI